MNHFHFARLAQNTLLVLAINFFCFQATKAAEFDDPKDWFQIEIVVFVQKSPDFEDELLPARELAYPADIMSIMPAGKKTLKPATLWQLEDQLQYKSLNLSRKNVRRISNRNTRNRFKKFLSKRGPLLPEPFIALPVEKRMLNPAVKRLKRSSRYRPLYHLSWQQPLITRKGQTSVLIQSGQRYGDFFELDGSLTFNRTRYTHVVADLWFTLFAQYEDAGKKRNEQKALLSQNTEVSKHPEILQLELNRNQYIPHQIHRIKEKRRLKIGEMNYIDSPAFGLLVKIDKYDWAESEEDGT